MSKAKGKPNKASEAPPPKAAPKKKAKQGVKGFDKLFKKVSELPYPVFMRAQRNLLRGQKTNFSGQKE